MAARSSTEPATAEGDPSPSSSAIGRAPTNIAGGAVPPSSRPGPTAAIGAPRGLSTNTNARIGDSRVGTYMRGSEGLQTPGTDAKLRLTTGKVIPGTRYRIIRWLGEGGMGVVYEAEHVDIERHVALKILRFDLSQQAKMVEVFKDEAKAAGRLGSQYLVDLYDFGELSDGRLFFAMELLDGHDLVPTDEKASMDPAVMIPILRQTCKGLGVAHRAGVVHRDIKPENILTTTAPDGREQVKIVDFGISSMLAAGSQSGGGLAGTPHYMAPELILSMPFDGRLDIYAIGCMAYEFLSGNPPFDAKTIEALLEKQVSDAPLPLCEVRPDVEVHPALEAVVMRCLAKDPAERYANTADLEAALCEAQIAAGITTAWDDLPLPDLPDAERRASIAARMPSPHAPAGSKRPSWVWPIVAGASTLAAVGLAAFLVLGRGPTDQEVDVVDQLTAEARSAASRANWVVPPANEPDASSAYEKVLDLEELEGTAEDLGDERGAELRQEFAGTLIKQADELFDHGAEDLARHYYLYALVFDETNAYALERSGAPPTTLGTYIALARQGKFSDVDRMLSAAAAAELEQDPEKKERQLDAAAELIDESSSEVAMVLASSKTARNLVRRKRRGGGSDDVDPLVAAVTKAPAPAPDPSDFELEDDDEDVDEDPEEAVEVDAEALDGPEAEPEKPTKKRPRRSKTKDPSELLGQAERNPAKAEELANEGLAALRSGQRSKASSLFNQAISFDRKNAKALMGLSDVYFDTGKNQKAVEYAERAVRASPSNQTYRLKLGDAYFKVLRYRDALEQYEKAKGSKRAQDRIEKVKAKLGG